PGKLLGTVENYLYLQSAKTESRGILLVPIQKIIGEHKAIPSGKLDIENTSPMLASEGVEWAGTQRYVALECDDRKISASGLEGRCMLAYIHFSQKKYE